MSDNRQCCLFAGIDKAAPICVAEFARIPVGSKSEFLRIPLQLESLLMRFSFCAALLVVFTSVHFLPAVDSPQVLDPRLKIEIVASEPDIVTPTGLAVDELGRIWCIENHTHQRTAEYKGPPTDRIRIYEDFDENGKARKVRTFAEGFKNTMSLALRPGGEIFLAERSAIYRIREKDGKEVERKVIVKLETKGDYPHNGLSDIAFDSAGKMYFGMGENLGEPYTLVGSDKSGWAGGGEGGNIFRCLPDGSKIERIATGFWNPFGMCFDLHGRLFAVDNDPDSRGPCRLLHVISGGDYGYRYRYGRKGLHPFQSWNGELPGTLPMVAGTSEAPSGILACPFAGWPKEYQGTLFSTSWGDHVIETFDPKPKGASFTASAKILVRGNENFRPVSIVACPDGSLVFNDWVDKSYPVHGKGRIWRLKLKTPLPNPAPRIGPLPEDNKELVRLSEILSTREPDRLKKEVVPYLASADPFLVAGAMKALTQTKTDRGLAKSANARMRLGAVILFQRQADRAAWIRSGPNDMLDFNIAPQYVQELWELIPTFLADSDPDVRRATIQWVAEQKLNGYAPLLEAAASKPPVTRELFEAYLAARDLLSDHPRAWKDEAPGEEYVSAIVKDPKQPVMFRLLALRMLRPDHPVLTPALLRSYLSDPDEGLRHEALRTLIERPDTEAQEMLRKFADDDTNPSQLRALAVVGLALSAKNFETERLLHKLRKQPFLQDEVLRTLGERRIPEPRHPPAEWQKLLEEKGDAVAGERVFFHPNGPGCYKCHKIDGRGAGIGPDLSRIASSMSREKIIESILEPSKEIAPAFTTWRILTRDGKERTGMIVGEDAFSYVTVADSQGKVEKIHRREIEDRTALPKSIMPENLPELITRQDFKDLLAFLLERR
jgi:putative membrane-bound dehydrogenase-like protein